MPLYFWFKHFLDSSAEFCQIFRSFIGQSSFEKKCFWDLLTFNCVYGTFFICYCCSLHSSSFVNSREMIPMQKKSQEKFVCSWAFLPRFLPEGLVSHHRSVVSFLTLAFSSHFRVCTYIATFESKKDLFKVWPKSIKKIAKNCQKLPKIAKNCLFLRFTHCKFL